MSVAVTVALLSAFRGKYLCCKHETFGHRKVRSFLYSISLVFVAYTVWSYTCPVKQPTSHLWLKNLLHYLTFLQFSTILCEIWVWVPICRIADDRFSYQHHRNGRPSSNDSDFQVESDPSLVQYSDVFERFSFFKAIKKEYQKVTLSPIVRSAYSPSPDLVVIKKNSYENICIFDYIVIKDCRID